MKNILKLFSLVSISVFFIVTHAFGDVLSGGKKIRILGIGDPVFQVMQKILPEMEAMAGGTLELDIRGFDPFNDAVYWGKELIPLLREKIKKYSSQSKGQLNVNK